MFMLLCVYYRNAILCCSASFFYVIYSSYFLCYYINAFFIEYLEFNCMDVAEFCPALLDF